MLMYRSILGVIGFFVATTHAFADPIEVFRFANGNRLVMTDGVLELRRQGGPVIPLGSPKLVPVSPRSLPPSLAIELTRLKVDHYFLSPEYSLGVVATAEAGTVVIRPTGIYVPLHCAKCRPTEGVEVRSIGMKDGPALVTVLGGVVNLIDSAGDSHFIALLKDSTSFAGRRALEARIQNFSNQTREDVNRVEAEIEAFRLFTEVTEDLDRLNKMHLERVTRAEGPWFDASHRYALTQDEHRALKRIVITGNRDQLAVLIEELRKLRTRFSEAPTYKIFESCESIAPAAQVLDALSKALSTKGHETCSGQLVTY